LHCSPADRALALLDGYTVRLRGARRSIASARARGLTCSRSFATQRMDHGSDDGCGDHGSDAYTTDSSADAQQAEGATEGVSNAQRVLAAHARSQRRVQDKRAAQRGGAAPTPHTDRHVGKGEQYERDVSPNAILDARDFDCACGLEHCAEPTTALITACRLRKRDMLNFGTGLRDMLRSAVVAKDGGLQLNWTSGQVHISASSCIWSLPASSRRCGSPACPWATRTTTRTRSSAA
jgi:hypothetical protein